MRRSRDWRRTGNHEVDGVDPCGSLPAVGLAASPHMVQEGIQWTPDLSILCWGPALQIQWGYPPNVTAQPFLGGLHAPSSGKHHVVGGQGAAHHSPLQSDLRRRRAAPAWPIGTRSPGPRNLSSPKEVSNLPQPSQLPCHSLPTPAKSRSGLPVAQT